MKTASVQSRGFLPSLPLPTPTVEMVLVLSVLTGLNKDTVMEDTL